MLSIVKFFKKKFIETNEIIFSVFVWHVLHEDMSCVKAQKHFVCGGNALG
jgi:hypothetical protein